jgi:hypothetical protein
MVAFRRDVISSFDDRFPAEVMARWRSGRAERRKKLRKIIETIAAEIKKRNDSDNLLDRAELP